MKGKNFTYIFAKSEDQPIEGWEEGVFLGGDAISLIKELWLFLKYLLEILGCIPQVLCCIMHKGKCHPCITEVKCLSCLQLATWALLELSVSFPRLELFTVVRTT